MKKIETIQAKSASGDRLTEEEIVQLVEYTIPIDPKIHCLSARLKRRDLRVIAAKKLREKYGYK